MKRSTVSVDFIIILVVAVLALALFAYFIVERSRTASQQFEGTAPEEYESARDSCRLACSRAKLYRELTEFQSSGFCMKSIKIQDTTLNCYNSAPTGLDITCDAKNSAGQPLWCKGDESPPAPAAPPEPPAPG